MRMDVQEVTDIAKEYVKRAGYVSTKVIEVSSDEITKKWKVSVDVGAYVTVIKIVIINDTDGKIIRFE